MKIQRLRMGIEVFNKVDGKEYKVMKVDGTTGTAVEMHMDPEGTLAGLGDEEITITKKNALAFRILNDPEPYPVPEGYSVEDGVLLKDGEPACVQGEFSFVKICAKCEDCLILAAKIKGMKDGEVALVSYQVTCDLFRKLTVVPERIVFLGYTGLSMEKAVFLFSTTEEKEAEADGEKKKVSTLKETALIVIDKGRSCDYQNLSIHVTAEDCFIKPIPGNENGAFDLFLASDTEAKDGVLVRRKERLWGVAHSCALYRVSTFSHNGEIRADWSPAYCDFVIRGEGMLRFKDIMVTDPKVNELDGYDILIDVTEGDHAYKLTFSNGDYEFKTLVSRSTRDRGCIVTVEEAVE